MNNKKPHKLLPLHKMIPNMITLTALAAGMTSIRFAIAERWEAAVLALVAAAFMDAFDGAAARILKATSRLGAELDSLSDFVCFGVAPALIVYLWSLHTLGRWGWFIVLVYAMAIALRLARFNVGKEEEDEAQADDPLNKYFTGVPAPIDGLLCLLPLVVFFQTEHTPNVQNLVKSSGINGLWMLVVAAMAISNIPTFSSKQIHIPYKMKIVALGLFTVTIAGLINDPWPTLIILATVYLFMLPFGVRHYNKKAAAVAKGEKDMEEAED